MNALDKAFSRSNALINTTQAHALQLKESGMLDSMVSPSMSLGSGGDWQAQSKNRESYAYFRSWVYAAINAIASKASTQPVNVGKLNGGKTGKKSPGKTKAYVLEKLPTNIRHKAANQELEILKDHKLLKTLERPNPIQYRQQFVYLIVANLNLTGRAYIVRDEGENGTEFYALPTTWVRPDHSKGPFAQFRVVNPRDAGGFDKEAKPLDASQVAMIYLPNPADPMGALSPATCMSAAIRVDDRIQTCQEKFFDNGIFPSVVVTVGKDPHPDVPGGVRPRLTGTQRRQVVGAIRRVMGGVANYGNPAIVDGLIESITRLSMSQNELGWDKSEDKLKMRILSAFCVHPFMLGESMNVGGYSQSSTIKEVFYDRVNVFTDLLSTVMTYFCANSVDEAEEEEAEGNLLIWWEALKPKDPSLENQRIQFARTNGDIGQNEFRALSGLPPNETESVLTQQLTTTVVSLLGQTASGAIRQEQVVALLEANGVETDLAEKIAGIGLPPLEQPMPMSPDNSLPLAAQALNEAVAALKIPIMKQVDDVMHSLGY